MNVGIDGRSLAGGQPGRGVARYVESMTAALAAGFPQDRWRVLVLGRAESGWAGGVDPVVRRLPRRLAFGSAALAGRPRLDRLLGESPNVVWAPAPAPLAVSRDVPFVLTVHDLSFELRPRDFTRYERAWHRLGRLPALARRADRVLTDSHATRDDALARWGLDPDRVLVVEPGVDRPAAPPDPERARHRHGLPERYLLFVGALEPRKAPEVIARAYARARAGGLDPALVVVGEGRLADALDVDGVIRIPGPLDRPAVEALYAGALALVMPSWLEGYGLPPLEAAACGTPSVVSDLPVFRETLGDAALRFAPGDEAELAAAITRIASDDALRRDLAARAGAAVAERTWERAAARARAVLAEVAR